MKILIGGIGNVLLGDDGVGPYVARLLEARYEFEDGVEIDDLGTPALDLIDRISGKDAVILIDSIDTDVAPGTVVLYRKADIMRQRPAVRMDPHAPALVDAILSAELFGVAPAEVLLVGIKAESFETGCSLTEMCIRDSPYKPGTWGPDEAEHLIASDAAWVNPTVPEENKKELEK